jgi:hypothetical protein
MRGRSTTSMSLLAVVALLGTTAPSKPHEALRDRQPKTKALFELANQQTGFIKVGSSRIVAVSSWATHTDHQPPFGSEGIEILFFTRPITDADKPDIVTNDAKQLKKGDFATFILFLDKSRKIAQVNMSYIIPGTTVARTVASTPAELANFSAFTFDGKRLQLRSKGVFSETNSKNESLKLSWDVDIDVPVVERGPR